MSQNADAPRTVEDAIRELKILTITAMDPEFPPSLRPVIFQEYKATEILLAHLLQARGEPVQFLA